MLEIINGPNGKFFLATISFLGFSTILLCAFGMQHGYSPTLSYGNANLSLSKAGAVII
jgi:hypothetical protein